MCIRDSAYTENQCGNITRKSPVNLLLLSLIRFGKLPYFSFVAGGSPTGRLYEDVYKRQDFDDAGQDGQLGDDENRSFADAVQALSLIHI